MATYGNSPNNPNQAKVQALCASIVPGATAANFVAPYERIGCRRAAGLAGGQSRPEAGSGGPVTAGVVFSPDKDLVLDSRLSLSLDLYDIDLKGAIAGLTNTQSYQLCFNANGTSNPTYDPSSPYCQVIVRSPFSVGGTNVTVRNAYPESGRHQDPRRRPAGGLELADRPGRFDFNVAVQQNDQVRARGSVERGLRRLRDSIDASGPAYYKWRSLITPSYTFGNASVGLRWKHLPSVRSVNCVTAACLPPTDKYDLLDAFGGYRLGESVRLSLGVDNLLDKDPPVVGGVVGNTNLGEYDLVGRAYWAGVRVNF